MLSDFNLSDTLKLLGLSQVAAARLLSVDPRTVRRWVENPAEISGPAEQALRAWHRLHQFGLPWSPDGVDLIESDPENIAIYRLHTLGLDALLEKVTKRGGPAAPWVVDLDKGKATLNGLEITFYKLRAGGFSPQSYKRGDGTKLDVQRDWHLIEDAFACIAAAMAIK
jgi:transcriptional regulator with XRE-family HTH domain